MLRRLKGIAVAVAVALAGAASLAALSGSPAHAQNTFRMGFQGNLNTLDPYTINETFTLAMLGNVYEGLTARGPNLQIIPGLAERWEIQEGARLWRFHLRRGVKFQGGEDFTADDVIFSAQRIRGDTSDLRVRIPNGAEFIKVDNFTVDVRLPTPNPILIADWDTFYIMSRTWAERNNATQAVSSRATEPGFSTLNANGTGAFRVTAHQPGVRTELTRNPNWWNDANRRHNLDRVIFTPILNDATRVAALLSGEVDWVDPVPVQDMDRVNANATTRVMAGPETRTIYLGFDQRRDQLLAPAEIPPAPAGAAQRRGTNPFKDVRVRRAFYQAIDVNLIVQRVMRGQARASALMIDPNLFPRHAAEFQRLAFDTAAAERLLDEAGYPRVQGFRGGNNRFSVGMDCPNDRYVNDAAICQAVIAMLARVGIHITPIIQPRAQYFGKILAGGGYNTNFYLLGWTPGTNDSHNVLIQLHGCRDDRGTGGVGVANVGGYCNERVRDLTNQILVEADPVKRDGLIRDAFRITVNEDVAYIPLHQQALAWGVNRRVEMAQRPDNVFMLYHVMMR
jgi:peptide/nickel transport system substrate-binding protein